jgi:hypothetical protein
MMMKIVSNEFYNQSQAIAAGVPRETLNRLRRYDRDGQMVYLGEDLEGVLTFAEEERRQTEAAAAHRPATTDPYGLGPPTR